MEEDVSAIVARLAGARVVEEIVDNITHGALHRGADRDLVDLVQDIYVVLLTYPAAEIIDLERAGHFKFFIARVVLNQVFSKKSPYYRIYKKFAAKANPITERTCRIPDDE